MQGRRAKMEDVIATIFKKSGGESESRRVLAVGKQWGLLTNPEWECFPAGGSRLKSGRADTTPNDDDDAGSSRHHPPLSFLSGKSTMSVVAPAQSTSSQSVLAAFESYRDHLDTHVRCSRLTSDPLWLRDCADAPGLPSSRLAGSTTSETSSTRCVLCPITLWFLICHDD